ncbi:2-dehydropantoate 2-reductase [Saitoella complicata NRRL Y-17804]|nr:2-dehydropantoate 2-reductase [Saitoella complicata NRRL Y-17804]ODQ50547.1 2-dehydropantoate 2-reductase [Saitoella complicata NRRL Y-17804]
MADALQRLGGIKVDSHAEAILGNGLDVEVNNPKVLRSGPRRPHIKSLIVTTKAIHALEAVELVAPRLSPSSTVVLLQNGMGVLDEVIQSFWPDAQRRPNFVVGTTTHAVKTGEDHFHINHAGLGKVSLGIVPSPFIEWRGKGQIPSITDLKQNPRTQSLAWTIASLQQASILGCHLEAWDVAQNSQLEKLIVNACINPLTALFNCLNGELLVNRPLSAIIRTIVTEAITCIMSTPRLRELASRDRFDPDRVYSKVKSIARSTAFNRSSMLQDIDRSRDTEIDYINGYIVRLGQAAGVATPVNDLMVNLVKARFRLKTSRDLSEREILAEEARLQDEMLQGKDRPPLEESGDTDWQKEYAELQKAHAALREAYGELQKSLPSGV